MKLLRSPKSRAKRVINAGRRAKGAVRSKSRVAGNYSFNIDSPQRKLQENRMITVEGWIIAKKESSFKLRAVNNKKIYELVVNKRRPDVANSFPKALRQTALHSGFSKEFEFEDGSLLIELDEGRGFKKIFETALFFDIEKLPKAIYNKDLSNNYPEHVNLLESRKKLFYEKDLGASYVRDEKDPRLVAFYLPQFHPFEENNRAWGKGFTEWSNVTTAEARFIGHQQPILPKDLGFYDLRYEPKILEQIELAKRYGIYGFMFYYYWFSGKKVMDKPLKSFLNHKDWDFNFSICWANENWTKRWDGRESDVIIAQEYRDEDPLNFIKDVESILLDKRYITEDGKPVLTVYRASELKDPKRYARVWRGYFRKKYNKELQLVSCLSFDNQDPREYGFDAALDFAPLSAFFKNNQFPNNQFPYVSVREKLIDINFEGVVADYRSLALNGALDSAYNFPTYPCITPSWDNDARKKGKGFVYQNSSPDIYAEWLRRILGKENQEKKQPLIFINAWNEWAEGAMLEPSVHLGYAVLNRTVEALSRESHNEENVVNFPQYRIKRQANKKLAVIIHLYYVELWPDIREKLKLIDEPFDLFVSLSERNKNFTPRLKNKRTKIYVYVTPNRGRDVLPFLSIAQKVRCAGYEYVLKVHSKKSKHRSDGKDWLASVLENLLPGGSKVTQAIKLLNSNDTGVIGPSGHLVSLKRHMGSNSPILENLLTRIYGKEVAEKVIKSPEAYPYFGGTMFWSRMDAIVPILDLFLLPDDFQSEHGQIDGTAAHAIERLFCIVTRLENKQLFSISKKGIKKIEGQPFLEKYKFAP